MKWDGLSYYVYANQHFYLADCEIGDGEECVFDGSKDKTKICRRVAQPRKSGGGAEKDSLFHNNSVSKIWLTYSGPRLKRCEKDQECSGTPFPFCLSGRCVSCTGSPGDCPNGYAQVCTWDHRCLYREGCPTSGSSSSPHCKGIIRNCSSQAIGATDCFGSAQEDPGDWGQVCRREQQDNPID